MPYEITLSDGTVLTTVNNQVVDTSTSLALVGRRFAGYGGYIAENFVHMLENFASITAPANPLTGQVWFNATANRLQVWTSGAWHDVGSQSSAITIQETTADNAGLLLYDPSAPSGSRYFRIRVRDDGLFAGHWVLESLNNDQTLHAVILNTDRSGNIALAGTVAASANVTINAAGGWSSSNYGKQLLITTPVGFSNPAIGITDSNQTNLWAIANNGGTLKLSQMPAYTNNSTGPATCLTLDGTTVGVFGNLTVSGSFPSAPNVGRNKIHNPTFTVQQRGAGPFTTNGLYTADRWSTSFVNGTTSFTMPALADADRTAIGDEEALVSLQNVFVGTGAATDLNAVVQGIEGVRRLSNKTVTVSFWAKASSGTPKLGASLDQFFGTGGSPSASVNGTGQSVTISTIWTRYSLTFALPSTAGKTLGTNFNDRTQFVFWYSAGANFATRSGTVGVQSGTIQIWGVQVEVGSFATPLEKRDPRLELLLCRRFYRTGTMQIAGYNLTANQSAQQYDSAEMRVTPTISASFTTNSNCSGSTLAAVGTGGLQVFTTVTATGVFNAAGTYTASADY